MYSYDRTAAAKDDTTEAIKWMYAKRRVVIKKAFKGMKAEFEKIQDEAVQKFPDLDLTAVHRELYHKEYDFKQNLAR